MSDSIRSYLKNRGILVQVCQDHKDSIDNKIFTIVNDVHVTVNAQEYLQRMHPIAVALDRMQRGDTPLPQQLKFGNKWRNIWPTRELLSRKNLRSEETGLSERVIIWQIC